MSDHTHVRVHLRQVIMVGDGNQARYAKVLTGIRQPLFNQRLSNGEALVAVDVYGCVTGGTNSFRVTPVEPHTHLLAASNILSIEDMALAPNQHFEDCPPSVPQPWQARRMQTAVCGHPEPHAAHQYHRSVAHCPGA